MTKKEKMRKGTNESMRKICKKIGKNSGITLIALVVTIVILIILATVSINAVFGQNGIIGKAKQAKEMYEQSVTNEDTAMQELLNELAQYEESGTATTVKASDISKASDKSAYYGKTVNGYICTNSAGVNAWQIFYADDSNIYLIASDYISSAYCPGSKTKSIYVNSDYCLSMNNVINDYQGSASVSNAGQSLNKSYFDYLTANSTTSTNNNMKAVAYMTDTDVWKVYAGAKAEYAIGGPTIEMLMKSYSQKYKVDYQAKATSATGYKISTDGGANWNSYISDSSKYLNTEDNQYVIKANDKAYAMWLASPSASDNYCVVLTRYNGYVYDTLFDDKDVGFRPLVCLQSDVQLVQDADGNFTIK